ncbi:MAG: polyketide cyclase [Dokdonella sp.]
MIRVLEIILSLIIVFLIAVVVAVFLPSSGHIERVVELSNPVRQIYDTIDGFGRYPDYSALRTFDPAVKFTSSGPENGVGAKIAWNTRYDKIGDGGLTITEASEDSQVKMAVENDWMGANKRYTMDLMPASNGKTVRVKMSYDVDYGWNLIWRFAGLYINGVPDSTLQTNLANLSGMMGGFPNVDYADLAIRIVDVTPKPILFVSTKAPRSLEDVDAASDAAKVEIEAIMEKAGLVAAGPPMTFTTNWGDESYTFDYAIPVDKASFTLDGKELTITALNPDVVRAPIEEEAPVEEPTPPVVGETDRKGFLVLGGNVRATQSYSGKALYAEYTGSPAALPLLRLKVRAYAETHGYKYSEAGQGRFFDESLSAVEDIYAGAGEYRVYLPILL